MLCEWPWPCLSLLLLLCEWPWPSSTFSFFSPSVSTSLEGGGGGISTLYKISKLFSDVNMKVKTKSLRFLRYNFRSQCVLEKIQILFSKFMRVFKQCALRLNCCQLFDTRKVRTLHKRADRAVFAQMSSLYRFRGYIRYCAYFAATQVKDSNGSAHSAVLTLMLRAGFEPGPLIS